ncbi:MAG TPA: radical SAM protein [Phycisphaerae bacterium]|nr:radical SAM protein [Phycisphaerae bacterium]
MLPFIYADMKMAPAGSRAIGAAMLDAGFEKTRIVLQQWNRNFRPSRMRLDNRIPDLFLVSSMQLHADACRDLIRDASRIDEAHRPLIIAGGPKFIYEPWDAFSPDPKDPWGADVVVTGEEYVLLSLLEMLLDLRASGESLRSAFRRARDTGALDAIPGLVYPNHGPEGAAIELVDTGIQRLVGDLDELPHPVLGYRLLEPPSKLETLGSKAAPAERIRKLSPISSLVLTFGCKFACEYCPIPAYNQRQHRVKSGERIADEFVQLYNEYGLHYFFGSDDNFFNDHKRTLDIVDKLAHTTIGGKPVRKIARWGTEVTVHDTLKLKDHIPLIRSAGVRFLWMGVEDMTATLVNKGQTTTKTMEAFKLLQQHGIAPMPMMMHHDDQPLISNSDKPYGLINQVRLLRKAGAASMQVLMLVPATGSKLFTGTYTSGMAYDSVAGKKVEEHMLGGNYVIASNFRKPWRKQANILIAYAYFYNPLRFLVALVRPKTRLYLVDSGMQFIGMWGLAMTAKRTIGWLFRLMTGKIERKSAPPNTKLPFRAPDGRTAAHALPGTPLVTLNLPPKRPSSDNSASQDEQRDVPLRVLAS